MKIQNSKKCINVNYTYKIKFIDNKQKPITLKQIEGDETYDVPFAALLTNFILPYCGTGHSVQGITKECDITIFDATSNKVSDKWLWVALTRNRDLDKVFFYVPPSKENSLNNESYVKKYIARCRISHKANDQYRNRKFKDEDYVNVDWVFKQADKLHGCCSLCNQKLTMNLSKEEHIKYDPTIISIDRINNKVAHTKKNCQIVCLKCNVRKH